MPFDEDMRRARRNIERRINGALRRSMLDIFGGIIEGTPVGNPGLWKNKNPPKGYVGGRLRNNWQISVDNPSGSLRGPNKGGAGSKSDLISYKFKSGTITYFTNNMPYAYRIEFDGWSGQAPEGVARINVKRFPSVLRRQLQNEFS